MDLAARIRRRQRSSSGAPLVVNEDALSPVAHLDEPVGRGPLVERLLDHLAPALDGRLPENAVLSGPPGSGKSAVVTALVAELDRLVTGSASAIYTTTRAQAPSAPAFVYVDARHARSEFGLVHAVLDSLLADSVPADGVGTATLRDRLRERVATDQAVVAVDHVGEPGGPDLDAVAAALDVPGVAWLAVGREGDETLAEIEVQPYDRAGLLDLLTERVSQGVGDGATHDQLARVADWADGDAHDALAAWFAAADRARAAGASRITDATLDQGMADVPRPGVPLGRVLTLPPRRLAVLRGLVALDEANRESVSIASVAIADRVALSASTVERFLYELAEDGIIERVPGTRTEGAGRPPSRLTPRFSTRVFRAFAGQED
ncbi:Cdc6/Cdc18 family protein [Natronomonas sp. EA1]|uniref:Cdc6/Cdc18 family protein n=1 Tax=Natronomonas sp. EA1 TaxID=3421655 RepID=UPI003EC13E88